MTTIPNHLALIPFNNRQFAAVQAINYVERKIENGQYIKKHPYAHALIQYFTGNKAAVTLKNLQETLLVTFQDKRERPSIKRYINALDIFIESRGMILKTPLTDSDIRGFFPELHYKKTVRKQRKTDARIQVESRCRQKESIAKEQRYQNRLAQAEIDLAFITPSQFKSWYQRFNRDGIHEYDLIELLINWTQRFNNLNLKQYLDFSTLWSAVLDLYDDIECREYSDTLLDSYVLPNKISQKKS